MKTNNARTYRLTKYGDPDTKRGKHLIAIITVNSRAKKIIGFESHVEGSGLHNQKLQ